MNTQDQLNFLRDALDYDRVTGVFRWLVSPAPQIRVPDGQTPDTRPA